MQLKIRHTIPDELVLPLSYHHIIQGIIYRSLAEEAGYSRQMHDQGYAVNDFSRRYKLFNFSLLRGNYHVANRQIIFHDIVEWEVRSPDIYMIRLLAEVFRKKGIRYGRQCFMHPELQLMNTSIEMDCAVECPTQR